MMCFSYEHWRVHTAMVLVTFFHESIYMEIAEHVVQRKHISYIILWSLPRFSSSFTILFYSSASMQATSRVLGVRRTKPSACLFDDEVVYLDAVDVYDWKTCGGILIWPMTGVGLFGLIDNYQGRWEDYMTWWSRVVHIVPYPLLYRAIHPDSLWTRQSRMQDIAACSGLYRSPHGWDSRSVLSGAKSESLSKSWSFRPWDLFMAIWELDDDLFQRPRLSQITTMTDELYTWVPTDHNIRSEARMISGGGYSAVHRYKKTIVYFTSHHYPLGPARTRAEVVRWRRSWIYPSYSAQPIRGKRRSNEQSA